MFFPKLNLLSVNIGERNYEDINEKHDCSIREIKTNEEHDQTAYFFV